MITLEWREVKGVHTSLLADRSDSLADPRGAKQALSCSVTAHMSAVKVLIGTPEGWRIAIKPILQPEPPARTLFALGHEWPCLCFVGLSCCGYIGLAIIR